MSYGTEQKGALKAGGAAPCRRKIARKTDGRKRKTEGQVKKRRHASIRLRGRGGGATCQNEGLTSSRQGGLAEKKRKAESRAGGPGGKWRARASSQSASPQERTCGLLEKIVVCGPPRIK